MNTRVQGDYAILFTLQRTGEYGVAPDKIFQDATTTPQQSCAIMNFLQEGQGKMLNTIRDLKVKDLHELFDLDNATGVLRWKPREGEWFSRPQDCLGWNKQFAGKEAGHANMASGKKYKTVTIRDSDYTFSHVVWAMSRGAWPESAVIHLNGDTEDNRPENLALAGGDNTEKPPKPGRAKKLPEQAVLLLLLHYDEETGVLAWNTREGRKVFNKNKAGKDATSNSSLGYRTIFLQGKNYPAHRIIFKWMTGREPIQTIDHVNGIKWDNRWCNLREATHAQNSWNTGLASKSETGRKNVAPRKSKGKISYVATVKKNKKYHYTRAFGTIEEANEAAISLRDRLHGDFANHG
jgi:hypothetical protein